MVMGIPLSGNCHPYGTAFSKAPGGSHVGSNDRQSLEGNPNISPSPEESEVSDMNVVP